MMRWAATVGLAVGLLLAGAPARAATLEGHVWDQAVNVPLAGAQVRVWQRVDSKNWTIAHTPTTDGDGYWSQVVGSGEYKVEAGGSPTGNPNQGGRWYDVDAPFADGWVGEDADSLFPANQDYTDLDVVLPINGGFEARVLGGSGPVSGIQARLVRGFDPRIHHNDQSRGDEHFARFYMRGLVPGDDHMLLLHDPSGAHALTFLGPYDIDPGVNLLAGDVTLAGPAVDLNELNNSASDPMAMSVDGAGLHASPPVRWTSATSGIGGPTDLDWYCWQAAIGDRYILSTTSVITVAGHTIANPWLDPMVSFWDARAAPVRLREDDDSGPDRDALLDTLDVPFAGTVCAVVTTFGDPDWNGGGQSVGPYTVTVAMGNRRPLVTVTRDGAEVPAPPEATVVDEDVEIVLDVTLLDPEGDIPWTEAEFVDRFGLAVAGWTYVVDGTTAQFAWTPGPTAAEGGPYVLAIEAGDNQLSAVTEVIVAVSAVNIPPEGPELLAPEDGATLAESFPELSVMNGTDIDEDDLWVEFETYLDPLAEPWDSELVAQDPSGVTSWTTEFVSDATQIWWRARVWDGQTYSAWTDLSEFLVATINDPPTVPVLDKPSLGEIVLHRAPALSAWTSTDPERDDISLLVEVSNDSTFETLFASSDPVPEDPLVATTTWTLDTDLAWSDLAFWRARAVDSRGAESDWSDVSWFRVKDNVQPTIPGLLAPWGPACDDVSVDASPTAIPVANAIDPEGEPLVLEVHVYEGDAPETAPPIYVTSAPQSGGATTDVPVVLTLTEDTRYRLAVRAHDGTDPSAWAQCWFWFDAVDSPTTGFAINEPVEGDVLVSSTVSITAEVSNPTDADAFVSGSTLSLAWCLHGGDLVCPASPAEWGHLAFASGLVTPFQVAGFVPDTDWTLRACAIDERGECKASDEVAFRTATPYSDPGDDDPADDEPTCGCTSAPTASFAWLLLAALIRRRR